VRSHGGARFYSASGTNTGVRLVAGSGSWTSLSDRNAKDNFTIVRPREILEKVAALPVQTWNYKSQDASVRHIGPTAQDFKAAFGVGPSDTGITTVDADGVALAAIQGLNQKVESRGHKSDLRMQQLEECLQKRDARIAELEQRLEALEQRLAE